MLFLYIRNTSKLAALGVAEPRGEECYFGFEFIWILFYTRAAPYSFGKVARHISLSAFAPSPHPFEMVVNVVAKKLFVSGVVMSWRSEMVVLVVAGWETLI